MKTNRIFSAGGLPLRAIIPLTLLFATTQGRASLYSYPEGKKPALPLEDAMEVCKTFMKKDIFKGFYITGVSANGSKEQDSSGTWNFVFHKEGEQKEIMLSIFFPGDECVIQFGNFPELEAKSAADIIQVYTRDGNRKPEPPSEGLPGVDPFAPEKKGD